MAPQSRGSANKAVFAALALIIVGVIVLEVLSAMAGPPPGSATVVSTSACTTSQPGTVFIMVSNASKSPVAAAVVSATNVPAYCGGSAAVAQKTTTFVTDGDTIWYSLPGQDNEGYTFAVRYQGQSYGFSIVLVPLSTTCAILYVPSGTANVTDITEPSCPIPSITTTTSPSQLPASPDSES